MGLASLKWMSCCSILQMVLTRVLLHEPERLHEPKHTARNGSIIQQVAVHTPLLADAPLKQKLIDVHVIFNLFTCM